MAAITIRRTLDSETLHLPELRPLLGKTVEIVVREDEPTPAVADRLRAMTELFKDGPIDIDPEVYKQWREYDRLNWRAPDL
jgi:hypothetical protein